MPIRSPKPFLIASLLSATAFVAPAAAMESHADSEKLRASVFEQIDQNSNDAISRREFRTFAREEHDMRSAEADALFTKVAGEDETSITLAAFRDADALDPWFASKSAMKKDEKSSSTNSRQAANRSNATNNAADEDDDNDENDAEAADARAGQSAASRGAERQGARNEDAASGGDDDRSAGSRNANFAAMDANGNGAVSRSEFTSFISGASNVSRSEARELFDAAAGSDATLTLSEFVERGDDLDDVARRIASSGGSNAPRTASASGETRGGNQGSASSASANRAADASRNDNDRSNASQRSANAEKTTNRGAGSASTTTPRAQPASATASANAGLSRDQMRALFARIDENGDGEIRKAEYLEFVRNGAERQFGKMAEGDDGVSSEEFMAADHDFLNHNDQ